MLAWNLSLDTTFDYTSGSCGVQAHRAMHQRRIRGLAVSVLVSG